VRESLFGVYPQVARHTMGELSVVRMPPANAIDSSDRAEMTSIESLPAATDKLEQLRPVTFHLKTEPNGALQYGLIAEEVVKVYPDLVIRDENGRIDGVRYDELAPILLSEVQRQRTELKSQTADLKLQSEEIAGLKRQTDRQAAEIAALKQQTAEIGAVKQQVAELIAANDGEHLKLARR
jgi:hypothetical protein